MPLIDQHIIDRLDRIVENTSVKNKQRRRTYNTPTVVEEAGQIKVKDTANTTFFNAGTSNFVILGSIVLAPGQGIAFPVNENEVDVTNYTYSFNGAGTNLGYIIQRLYSDPNE